MEFRAYINEMHGSKSKIPRKKSRQAALRRCFQIWRTMSLPSFGCTMFRGPPELENGAKFPEPVCNCLLATVLTAQSIYSLMYYLFFPVIMCFLHFGGDASCNFTCV
jgi:hypothetical protein